MPAFLQHPSYLAADTAIFDIRLSLLAGVYALAPKILKLGVLLSHSSSACYEHVHVSFVQSLFYSLFAFLVRFSQHRVLGYNYNKLAQRQEVSHNPDGRNIGTASRNLRIVDHRKIVKVPDGLPDRFYK